MQIKTNNGITWLFEDGEGVNYITESFPTHRHTFYPMRQIGNGETPDMYRQVSYEEAQAIKAADALWVRPPQASIDMCCALIGQPFKYNEHTGYFEDAERKDIEYADVLQRLSEAIGSSIKLEPKSQLTITTDMAEYAIPMYEDVAVNETTGGSKVEN